MDIWSFIGIASVIFVAYQFTKQLGVSLPILELMLLIAGLQWIIGPLIEYAAPTVHYKYYMYVDQVVYMAYVVPAYLLFVIIILVGLKRMVQLNIALEQLVYFSKFGLSLFFIGIVYDLFSGFLGFLGFLGYIISNFKFVGAIILYFSKNKRVRRLFYIAILFLLYRSLSNAMFHDFVLWSAFFYMFWAFQFKPSVFTKLTTFAVAGIFLISLQTIKAAYRSEVWAGNKGNKIELFVGLMYDALLGDGSTLDAEENNVDNNVRLNQGWIISAILDEIPKKTNYFGGSTIVDALSASLLPRFLDPDKAKAGGQENFRKFTGLQISDGTSMGISIIGEGYGNYGKIGGIFFMGFWALFVLLVWKYLLKQASKNILLVAFLPLIFLQVIKAETELVVVLNHLVKSGIVVLLFLRFFGSARVIKPIYES